MGRNDRSVSRRVAGIQDYDQPQLSRAGGWRSAIAGTDVAGPRADRRGSWGNRVDLGNFDQADSRSGSRTEVSGRTRRSSAKVAADGSRVSDAPECDVGDAGRRSRKDHGIHGEGHDRADAKAAQAALQRA